MPKFSVKEQEQVTTNYAGGKAYSLDARQELATILLTSFVTGQFYRSSGATLERVRKLVAREPLFAAKAGLYARDKFNMRSITHVVAGEVVATVKREPWVRRFVRNAMLRVDDMTETLAYYQANHARKPIPNSLKRGLRDAFDKFDNYQIAKYQGKGRTVSLIDLVRVVHPSPTHRNAEALAALVKGELGSTSLFADMTRATQDAEDIDAAKGETWKVLLSEGKLGYFALLRNLRNIIKDADTDTVQLAAEQLANEAVIRKSRVLPFRYLTAFDALAETNPPRTILEALNKATEIAVSNTPDMTGTLVAVDLSGSMGNPFPNSKRNVAHMASFFGAVLYKRGADVLAFASDAKWPKVNPADSIFGVATTIMQSNHGGTNFNAIFDAATKPYERIVILSDEQGWMGGGAPIASEQHYRKRTNSNPHIYLWDMAGYGTAQFPRDRIYLLSGFSEKALDVMHMLERDRQALVHEIEGVAV